MYISGLGDVALRSNGLLPHKRETPKSLSSGSVLAMG